MANKPICTIEMKDGGIMTFELYPEIAPITVANFADVSNCGRYDGLLFHRVKKGFVIQGGSPDGTMDGDFEFKIKGEFDENGHPNPIKHDPGVISMARDNDPNTAGAHFFIMHGKAERLDGKYAAFGKILTGFDVVEKMVETEVEGEWDRPKNEQVIKQIRVNVEGINMPKVERIYPM